MNPASITNQFMCGYTIEELAVGNGCKTFEIAAAIGEQIDREFARYLR